MDRKALEGRLVFYETLRDSLVSQAKRINRVIKDLKKELKEMIE